MPFLTIFFNHVLGTVGTYCMYRYGTKKSKMLIKNRRTFCIFVLLIVSLFFTVSLFYGLLSDMNP